MISARALAAIEALRSPTEIRARCAQILSLGEAGELEHFRVNVQRLDDAAEYVRDVIAHAHPDHDIPVHSRWRHFCADGVDRWGMLDARIAGRGPDERARVQFELAISSVLLDAGAGEQWRYREPGTSRVYRRSEGLAVASFYLYTSGAFSSELQPQRVDASALEALSPNDLARAFQVSGDNCFVGLAGRARLLNALGRTLRESPEIFGAERPRLGRLFDHLRGKAHHAELPAREILAAILSRFSTIWPSRCAIEGIQLGDVWMHPQIERSDPTDRLVPFHKLSQWMSYSLIEPLEQAGITVTGLDELTGLAEYRNGGLFIDLGVIEPKDRETVHREHEVGSEVIVEWRALTVALLDRLADRIRTLLHQDEGALPLVKILEGGTWSAGRRIAAEHRADGSPPIRVRSDGTVF